MNQGGNDSTYIDHRASGSGEIVHSWPDHTLARLAWLYGPERACAIDAGNDPKTNADIQAWRALGRRTGEAA